MDNEIAELDVDGNFKMVNPEDKKIYSMILGPDDVKEPPFDF